MVQSFQQETKTPVRILPTIFFHLPHPFGDTEAERRTSPFDDVWFGIPPHSPNGSAIESVYRSALECFRGWAIAKLRSIARERLRYLCIVCSLHICVAGTRGRWTQVRMARPFRPGDQYETARRPSAAPPYLSTFLSIIPPSGNAPRYDPTPHQPTVRHSHRTLAF